MQKIINSVNVSVLDFVVSLDIQARTMTFSTASTVYASGGQAAIGGICFSVEDSSGLVLLEPDFTAVHIGATGSSYVFQMPSHYAFMFQLYKISALLKEADGTIYTADMPVKEICRPEGLSESGYCEGFFTVDVDCTNNRMLIKEETNLTYKKLQPAKVVKNGTLYFPLGTRADIAIYFTPFEVVGLYTGTHRIRNSSLCTYDLGDGMTVILSYVANAEFVIKCGNRLSEILCCIEEEYNAATKNCGNAAGRRAKENLEAIQLPLMTAIVKETRGIDACEEIELIKKKLKCDCGCGSRQSVALEATPVDASSYSIIISGAWATTVDAPVVSGNTKLYTIRTKYVVVAKADLSDQGLSIRVDNSTDGQSKYLIGLSYAAIAAGVISAIGSSQDLHNQFQSLLNQFTGVSGISLDGYDGRTIIDTVHKDYSLLQVIKNAAETVTGVTIDGQLYVPSSPILLSNTAGLQNWLHSLGKGDFTVTSATGPNGVTVSITSEHNGHQVNSMNFAIPGQTAFAVGFSQTSVTLVSVLQAITDYLVDLTAKQVQMGEAIILRNLDSDGELVNTAFTAETSVLDVIKALSKNLSDLYSYTRNVATTTCATLADIFKSRPESNIAGTDYLLGTKSGQCSRITYKELAAQVLAMIKSDADIKNVFCSIDCTVPSTDNGCPGIQSFVSAATTQAISLSGIVWTFTPAGQQNVKVEYRIITNGVPGAWVTAVASLTVPATGIINGGVTVLANPAAGDYEIGITNLCGGPRYSAPVNVPAPPVISWEGMDAACETAQQYSTTDAIPPTGNQGLVANVRSYFNTNGAKIYADGFPISGLGTELAHLTTPHFWVNGTEVVAADYTTSANFNDGRMNPNAVWVDGNVVTGTVWEPVNEWIGFSRKITLPSGKYLYIGISGDNFVKLKINGKEILNTQLGGRGTVINYMQWSIFPVFFAGGDNFIEMAVYNLENDFPPNSAGFACEIYDMTLAQLKAATSEADLNILFRTRDMIGQPFDLGVTIGWSCLDGWSLHNDAGVYTCVKTDMVNTGRQLFATRRRLSDGIPDGYSEANTAGVNYIAPIDNAAACPLPGKSVTLVIAGSQPAPLQVSSSAVTYPPQPANTGNFAIQIATGGVFKISYIGPGGNTNYQVDMLRTLSGAVIYQKQMGLSDTITFSSDRNDAALGINNINYIRISVLNSAVTP